jgi:hypothetical protein
MTTWSQQEDKRLIELLAEGWSHQEIAVAMAGEGFPVRTRNAVIGRADRIGHKSQFSAKQREKKPAAVSSPVKRQRAVKRAAARPEPVVAEPPPAPVVEAPPPPPAPVHIFEAKGDECRFPLWPHWQRVPPSELMVCGAKTAPGDTYCAACKLIAYQPAGARAA